MILFYFLDKSNVYCKYCKKPYNLPRYLLKHEKEHELAIQIGSDEKHIVCNFCKAKFSLKEEFKTHQMEAHADLLSKTKAFS